MQLTKLLHRLQGGDRDVVHTVMPLVYEELKKLARANLRREARAVPLETTALVHEAFLKLSASRHPYCENRAHFYGIVSRLMRQVLVETARARAAEKRGAALEVALADLPELAPQPNRPLLAMDDALRMLEETDSLKGQLRNAIFRWYDGGGMFNCAIHACAYCETRAPPGPSLAAQRNG